MDEAEAQEKLEQALPKEMISKVQQEALLLLTKSESSKLVISAAK